MPTIQTALKEAVKVDEGSINPDFPQFFSWLSSHLYWTRYSWRGDTYYKAFYFEGDRNEAKIRMENHCKLAGYRHLWTEPVIHDLATEEEKILKGL